MSSEYVRRHVIRCRNAVGRIAEWTGKGWDPYRGLLYDERADAERTLAEADAARPAGTLPAAIEIVTFAPPRTRGPQLGLPLGVTQ